MKRQTGFTIVEMLVTMVIAVILATVGVPSMVETVRNNRIATTTNQYIATIYAARAEAIKRNVPVSICASANSTAASPSCGGGAGYEDGWVVFAEVGAGEPDGTIDDDDIVLRVNESVRGEAAPAAPSITIRGQGNFVNRVSFRPNGLIQNALGGTLTVCDSRGASKARRIVLAASGRTRLDDSPESPECVSS